MIINVPVFFTTLVIGLFLVYISAPPLKTIVVYPTKDNKHLFQFRDKANNCFHLEEKREPCSSQAEIIPIQI
tara:strand:+ start:20217 stop:20432 length:216 start_codon:yes stop_codon:yes gene_type:complete